jgi:hypothetical protein
MTRANKEDDIIRIRPLDDGTGLYSVTYEDQNAELKFYFEDNWNAVSTYLAQVFAVLPLDREPYEHIQFNAPAYPCICIKPYEASDEEVMRPIWSMLESVARGWPARVKGQ